MLDDFFDYQDPDIERQQKLLKCSAPIAQQFLKNVKGELMGVPKELIVEIAGEDYGLDEELMGLWLDKWEKAKQITIKDYLVSLNGDLKKHL